MYFDFTKISEAERYHLTTQTVIPRPVAWILTDSEQDNYNLAPFSYFTAISSNPPLLMVSIGPKPNGDLKDTILNAKTYKKMVIHIASDSLAEDLNKTAKDLPHGESEVDMLGAELVEFKGFLLPRLRDCDIAFGCTLFEIKEIGNKPQSLLFAQIEHLFVSDSVTEMDGNRAKINAKQISPLARLGGMEYANLDKVFAIERPK
ncbi:MAG: flavin reductase family protein [Flavobacteriales bacterium]|nr:flavin reductase family protein [Flavobacteriales bacterium]